jgi:hypothetical protein
VKREHYKKIKENWKLTILKRKWHMIWKNLRKKNETEKQNTM